MKTIGIVTEDHKAQRFLSQLQAAGFTVSSLKLGYPLKGHQLIKVLVTDESFTLSIDKIAQICAHLQITFTRQN